MDTINGTIKALTEVSQSGERIYKIIYPKTTMNQVVDLNTTLAGKVSAVSGKTLTSNDFTNSYKNKLDGIETGAQVNTVTGIKGNNETTYRVGNINITKANIGLSNVDNTADINKTVAAAINDSLGNNIALTYETKENAIVSLTVNGKTITYTKGNGTTGTITTKDTTYNNATTVTSGLMSSSDKIRLNNIEDNANNYILTAATNSSLGGVITGANITNTNGTISLTKTNVTTALGYTPPTVNTTYDIGTATTSGITKLYTSTGTNTDGTMTQNAIKSALDNKLDSSSYAAATSSTAGKVKLYTSTGNSTDGTMDRNSITNALNGKLGSTATATAAAKLATSQNIQVNLASTVAAGFDGSSSITPGVTGTLAVANGGTGATSLDNITVGKAVYDSNNKKISEHTVEYIVGTQTASTGAWTGVTKDAALYTGKIILYKLPYAGSGNATLNLTLSGGSTTGAKNIYRYGATALTTQYAANYYIPLIYNGTSWFAFADYDSTVYDRLRVSNTIAVADGAIAATKFVGSIDGNKYKQLGSGTTFDIRYPIFFNVTAVATGATMSTGLYYVTQGQNMQTASGTSATYTAQKPLYLKGTISGTIFNIDSSVLTTTVPTSEDGFYYLYVGRTYSTTNANIDLVRNQYWVYINGLFQPANMAALSSISDIKGQRIDSTYIKGLSISGTTITYTKGNGTTGTITTQDTNTDTKVTNTLGTTTKAYITGTTSATTSTGTQIFDTGVYLSTTAGELVATKFTGALNGNASSATKATQDASGNTITSHYATKSVATTSANGLMSSTDKTRLDTLYNLPLMYVTDELGNNYSI